MGLLSTPDNGDLQHRHYAICRIGVAPQRVPERYKQRTMAEHRQARSLLILKREPTFRSNSIVTQQNILYCYRTLQFRIMRLSGFRTGRRPATHSARAAPTGSEKPSARRTNDL